MQGAEQIWLGGGIATMDPALGPYGAIADGAMVTGGGRILWVGPRGELPHVPGAATHQIGGWITPGLIDCHTHAVFGGNRADEFEARLAGASYEAIARAGGGILSTVTRTRAASEAELFAGASARLAAMVAEGVTAVEIKSGYGLDLPTERRMLRVARALGPAHGLRVRTSFLGAHAVPPEFAGRADAYVEALIAEMLPSLAAEGLVDAVDAFCETIAFSAGEVRRLFAAARALGLPVKLHADQLSDGGGAALAAEAGAISADHLEYTSPAGARAMAASGTVAVLLPGAYQMVGARQPPPVAAFRHEGVPMAVATDCNPGSSPLCSPLLAMNLACTRFGLTPEEALAGFTRHAAQALGMQREVGRLAPGLRADFALWDIGHPRELAYWMGGVKARARVTSAQWVGSSPAK